MRSTERQISKLCDKSRRNYVIPGLCPFPSVHPRVTIADWASWDSYDLDLDKRLSEETTVLVENYTVRYCLPFRRFGELND